MRVTHIKMNEAQEQELQMLMEHEGYTNKSEFFRYLMKFYKFHQITHITRAGQISHMAQAHSQTQIQTAPEQKPIINDEDLSAEKRRLLTDPRIFDEEVRQFIREMPDD